MFPVSYHYHMPQEDLAKIDMLRSTPGYPPSDSGLLVYLMKGSEKFFGRAGEVAAWNGESFHFAAAPLSGE